MKRFFIVILLPLVWMCYSCKEDGMYTNINELLPAGETVYPAKFDTVLVKVGIGRVEIDLIKAGRIPASKIHLGKAVKTVIEYEGQPNDRPIVIDSVCSWVNITGLSMQKLYRFYIYTEDEYGNRSVPVEATAVPYTDDDAVSLATSIPQPRIEASTSVAVIEWPNGLPASLLEFHGLTFSYTDKTGVLKTGDSTSYKFRIENLQSGQQLPVNIKFKIVPKVEGVAILDTFYMEKTLIVTIWNDMEFEEVKKSYEGRKNSWAEFTGTATNLYWNAASSYIVQTELQYTNQAGDIEALTVLPSETTTLCPNAAQKRYLIKYRSLIKYEATGETWESDWQECEFPRKAIHLPMQGLGGWSWTPAIELPFDNAHPWLYTHTGTLPAGGFRFQPERSWSVAYAFRPTGGASGEIPAIVGINQLFIRSLSNGPDNNWTLMETGYYRIEVDMNEMEMRLIKLD
jgi:hypothetical protein